MAKIDGRTLDHKALEHLRMIAVKRVVEDGEAPSEVMKSLGLCRTSIYPWLRKFEDQGWEALVEKVAQGPEPKLNEKQRQQVRRWILGKDPRQYGLDYGLWTRRIVQSLIATRMKIDLGLTAVGRLLASRRPQSRRQTHRGQEFGGAGGLDSPRAGMSGRSSYRSWCRSHSIELDRPASSRPLGTRSRRW